MDKYQSRYRIPSARWLTWDYASNAAYFITICTAHREHCFGAVVNGVMILSPLGQSAVRGYKIGVTQYARHNEIAFAWQARYHDHVVRNEGEYQRIRAYICINPQKWADNTYYVHENS